MTIAGNQGQNVYPAPDNYPDSSFPQPVPAPDFDPDDADTLITVQYSWEWQPVLLAAVDQLKNPATWQGDHDQVITALNRATNLKDLLQQPVTVDSDVPAPWWDDDEDVDDDMPEDMQPWYGYVTDPEAPPAELDFVESAIIWGFTGFIAAATWEIGFAPAVLFNTLAKKMVLANKRGDVGEVLRIFIDGEEAARVDTTPYAAGDIIETPIVGDPALSTHEIMIVQVS